MGRKVYWTCHRFEKPDLVPSRDEVTKVPILCIFVLQKHVSAFRFVLIVTLLDVSHDLPVTRVTGGVFILEGCMSMRSRRSVDGGFVMNC